MFRSDGCWDRALATLGVCFDKRQTALAAQRKLGTTVRLTLLRAAQQSHSTASLTDQHHALVHTVRTVHKINYKEGLRTCNIKK